MKFRKKPVVIEAVQFHQLGDHPAVDHAPESPTGYGIHTLEHTAIKHEVTPGDWIITGVKGEQYPCKPDVFEQTYDAEGPTRYDSQSLTKAGADLVEAVKQQAEALARLLDQVPGRPASVALTHLQAAVMFGVRAVSETHNNNRTS